MMGTSSEATKQMLVKNLVPGMWIIDPQSGDWARIAGITGSTICTGWGEDRTRTIVLGDGLLNGLPTSQSERRRIYADSRELSDNATVTVRAGTDGRRC